MKATSRGFHVNINSKSYSLVRVISSRTRLRRSVAHRFLVFWGLTLILTLDILFQMVALWNTVLSFATNFHKRRTYLGGFPPRVFDVQGQFTFSPYKAKSFDIHSGLPCRWRWGALPIHHSVTEYECYLEKEQGDRMFYFQSKMFMVMFSDW